LSVTVDTLGTARVANRLLSPRHDEPSPSYDERRRGSSNGAARTTTGTDDESALIDVSRRRHVGAGSSSS